MTATQRDQVAEGEEPHHDNQREHVQIAEGEEEALTMMHANQRQCDQVAKEEESSTTMTAINTIETIVWCAVFAGKNAPSINSHAIVETSTVHSSMSC